jgi:hypothetical protein
MASSNRLSHFKKKDSNVDCLLDSNRRLAIQKEDSILKINKKVVETFFDCTLFLAKQGIAFRRDPQENGKPFLIVMSDLAKLLLTIGNFIQLINLLRRYDPMLDNWFNQEKFKTHHVIYIYYLLYLLNKNRLLFSEQYY